MISCDRVRELASGYVLGALEPEEMAAVEEHLESCPDTHAEVAELGGVLPYLAVAPEPLEPPSWLRDSVMAAVRADLTVRSRSAATPASQSLAAEPAPASPYTLESSEGKVVSLVAMRSRRHRVPIWLARAAAAVAVVALAGYALVVQNDLNKAKQDQAHAETVLNAAAFPGARLVTLTDAHGTGAGGTVALLPSGHVVVYANHLPQTTGNQICVVWLTGDNGAQVKVGSFYPADDGTGFLEVDNVPTSASLWVTVNLEPSRDVTRPTGPTIVSGVVSR